LWACSPEPDRQTRKAPQAEPEQSESLVQGCRVSVPQMRSGSVSKRQTSPPVPPSSATTAPRTHGLSRCDDFPTYTLPSNTAGEDQTCAPSTAGSGSPRAVFQTRLPLWASSAYTLASAAPK